MKKIVDRTILSHVLSVEPYWLLLDGHDKNIYALESYLDASQAISFVLMTGPPGSGVTSAMISMFRKDPRRSIWVAPRVIFEKASFVQFLTASLHLSSPDFADRSVPEYLLQVIALRKTKAIFIDDIDAFSSSSSFIFETFEIINAIRGGVPCLKFVISISSPQMLSAARKQLASIEHKVLYFTAVTAIEADKLLRAYVKQLNDKTGANILVEGFPEDLILSAGGNIAEVVAWSRLAYILTAFRSESVLFYSPIRTFSSLWRDIDELLF
ncbi:hypothetical protein [Pseudomonas lurida]|uniref:hypothetical protein n=1 Tax=Pseudomonas lurida TaxID=244566 RepID=UPI0030DA546D